MREFWYGTGAAIAVKLTMEYSGSTGWHTGGEASHGLFFRGGHQSADAIGVRDDMVDGRDTGEPSVSRHERLSCCRVGCCGQHRVERAEAGCFLEQA